MVFYSSTSQQQWWSFTWGRKWQAEEAGVLDQSEMCCCHETFVTINFICFRVLHVYLHGK